MHSVHCTAHCTLHTELYTLGRANYTLNTVPWTGLMTVRLCGRPGCPTSTVAAEGGRGHYYATEAGGASVLPAGRACQAPAQSPHFLAGCASRQPGWQRARGLPRSAQPAAGWFSQPVSRATTNTNTTALLASTFFLQPHTQHRWRLTGGAQSTIMLAN